MKSPLNQILVNYLKVDEHSNYLTLESIPQFKQFFCEYLQEHLHIINDNLDESFMRWCRQLHSGRVFPEARRFAVYTLWFRCELKQYHIARLLGVSTRTIRRDMRVIEKQLFH
jgi:hypothetical protein